MSNQRQIYSFTTDSSRGQYVYRRLLLTNSSACYKTQAAHQPESGHVGWEPAGGSSRSCAQCCGTVRTADCPTLEPAARAKNTQRKSNLVTLTNSIHQFGYLMGQLYTVSKRCMCAHHVWIHTKVVQDDVEQVKDILD